MNIKRSFFPRGVIIVECDEITFQGKDIIKVRLLKDFIYLLGGTTTIFKIGIVKEAAYYLITDTVAYVWVKND